VRQYELVFIVRPDADETRMNATVEKITKYVTDNGGEVTSLNPWGRRRLAYPIDRAMEGDYVTAKMTLEPTATQGLESSLTISEDVLRHLLLKVE